MALPERTLREGEFVSIPLSADGSSHLLFPFDEGRLGWARYVVREHPGVHRLDSFVFVRLGPERRGSGSPIQVRELWVSAPEGAIFSSPFLRTIPFARMTAAVNRAAIRDQVAAYLPQFNRVTRGTPSSILPYLGMAADEAVKLRPRLKVKDPGGRRKPDEFYEHVANVYLEQASISDRPARDIAEANGHKVTTVHRWLKEARNRGLLILPSSGQSGDE